MGSNSLAPQLIPETPLLKSRTRPQGLSHFRRLLSGSHPSANPSRPREMMASPVQKPEDTASYEDRRAFPRVPVAMPAFLQANGERHAVQVVDLSAGGAKLNCSASLPAGTAVVLDCG